MSGTVSVNDKQTQVMKYTASRIVNGKPVTAEVTRLSDCFNVLIYGGDKPHVGAVGIATPNGEITISEFPGHREGIVCREWVDSFLKSGMIPAVICAGIHYDGLDKAGIDSVLDSSAEMLTEILSVFSSLR